MLLSLAFANIPAPLFKGMLNLNIMSRIKEYFKGAIREFNNVTWPTRKQAIRISTIVFVFMIISAIVLGFADQLLSSGYKMLLSISL